MSIGMTILDNADGTGAVATITGTTGNNDVYYALFNGGAQVNSYSWTLAGSRSGDGTIAISLPVGFYWFMLFNGGVFTVNKTVMVYKAVTDASALEAHVQFLAAIVQRINTLALVPSQYVLTKWAPRLSDAELAALKVTPLIFVAPTGIEEFVSQTTAEDDLVLPAQVTICFAANQDSVANLNTMLSWRNRISRAVRWQRLAGLTGEALKQLGARARPGQIIDVDLFLAQNVLASHYFFGLDTRQTRGLT